MAEVVEKQRLDTQKESALERKHKELYGRVSPIAKQGNMSKLIPSNNTWDNYRPQT